MANGKADKKSNQCNTVWWQVKMYSYLKNKTFLSKNHKNLKELHQSYPLEHKQHPVFLSPQNSQ